MDPLSLTCNIAGVLTITTKLISVGYSYGSSVADFPEEVQELIAELTSLSGILSALEAVVDNPLPYQVDGATNERPTLIAKFLSSSLEECGKSLQTVLESLENQRVGSKAQKIFKRVTWPLKQNDTRDLFARLERYKKTFSLALSADEVTLTRSIFYEIGIIRKHQTMEAEKRELEIKNVKFWKIISWLSPVDPETNHVTARLLQQAGTGKWLTEGKAYQNWLSQDHSFLWLHGKPGAGKTILSSIIIDRVMSEVYTSSNTTPAVIYFYCDFKDSLKQTALGLLGSLIAQLVRKKSEIPDDIKNLYQQCDGGEKRPEVSKLGKCLYSIVKEFSKVVVIIDALDECVERDSLFDKLEWLQGNTNLLVTSREDLEIKLQFENFPGLGMREEDVSSDIKIFVSGELMRQPKLRRLKPATKLEITSSLTKGANGMFRWAKCCLDDISKLRNDKAIKAALLSLPPTLEQSYERILCNIPEDDRILAIRVFQWLLYSQRPMGVREVADAIATETGDKCMDPDSKLNEPEDITHICGSLVDLNRWNMTLGLAHFTVKEYLTSTNIARGPAAGYQILPHTANTELTKTCLTYILFDDFSTGPCKTEDEFLARLDEYPLLRYAPYYWPEHIRKYEIGSNETLDALVLSFFRLEKDCNNFLSWWQLYSAGEANRYDLGIDRLSQPDTPLYLAAQMGQHPAVVELLEGGADINDKGGKLGTALAVAAGEGHLETVRTLLEKGAGLLEKGKKQYKPLGEPMTEAARNGFPKCVQLLFDYGTEEPSEWIKGCQEAMSALRTPVPDEREDIMEILLASEYFRQAPAEDPDGPLGSIHPFLAAFAMCVCCGWEKSSRSMFKIGLDAIISAAKGRFLELCLHLIIENGHVKLLKMITQEEKLKGLYAKHDKYQAHLHKAAYYGQEKIIEFLLGLKEASRIEGLGISLHIAAAMGNIGIMERLLRAGANPLQEDDDGWSPMVYAFEYNENSAIEKLSVYADPPEALDINIGLIPRGLSLEPLGVGTIARRDQYPIFPPCANFSFEVEVKKRCTISIGFGDVLHSLNYDTQTKIHGCPGYDDMSWGYSSIGYISFSDRLDTQRVETFGAGDIIGCHFDRIRGLAFFTVNGKVVGKPVAEVKGKLIPMVGPNADQARVNFGASPFTYPTPSLSAEMLSNTWTACNGWWSNYTMTMPKPCA